MMQMQITAEVHTKASAHRQQRLDWDLAMLLPAHVRQVMKQTRSRATLKEGAEKARGGIEVFRNVFIYTGIKSLYKRISYS